MLALARRPLLQEDFERAKGGDPAALNSLFAAARPFVLHLARKAIGGPVAGRFAASDIAQSVLGDVARKFTEFRGTTLHEFICQLRKAVKHNVIDKHKTLHTQRQDVRREVALNGATCVAGGDQPDELATRNELRDRMAVALHALSTEDRRVLDLRMTEGLEFEAIAKRLGIAADSAKRKYNRALHRWQQAAGLTDGSA